MDLMQLAMSKALGSPKVKTYVEGAPVWDERELVFENNSSATFVDSKFGINNGIEYDVYWNGERYTCESKLYDEEPYLGNGSMVFPVENTGEPFCLYGSFTAPEVICYAKKGNSATETITVKVTTKGGWEYTDGSTKTGATQCSTSEKHYLVVSKGQGESEKTYTESGLYTQYGELYSNGCKYLTDMDFENGGYGGLVVYETSQHSPSYLLMNGLSSNRVPIVSHTDTQFGTFTFMGFCYSEAASTLISSQIIISAGDPVAIQLYGDVTNDTWSFNVTPLTATEV